MKGKENLEIGRGGELNTIIGKGTVINGDMNVQNSLRIDGKVIGNVSATDTVIVGKEGEVEGKVRGKNILLAGIVKGNVNASDKVYLETKASIFGDIKSSKLVIDEGAVFDGKSQMKNDPKSHAKKKNIVSVVKEDSAPSG